MSTKHHKESGIYHTNTTQITANDHKQPSTRAENRPKSSQIRQTYSEITSQYSAVGGHEQNRFRSPYALSIRFTGAQYLSMRREFPGKHPCDRE